MELLITEVNNFFKISDADMHLGDLNAGPNGEKTRHEYRPHTAVSGVCRNSEGVAVGKFSFTAALPDQLSHLRPGDTLSVY